jgi:hypothetical protein
MARRIESRNMGWPLLAASALCLLVALIEYFMPENGVDGTLGALIVVGSTALMLVAAAAVWLGYARKTLMVLILLDILGTGFAAYMLEANVLVGFIALASIAWLIGVFAGGRPRAPASAQAMP